MNKEINIGHNIRKWRELRGIERKVFAEKLGICKASMSNYENNKAEINTSRLLQIAEVLSVDINLLFKDPSEFLPPHPIAQLYRTNQYTA